MPAPTAIGQGGSYNYRTALISVPQPAAGADISFTVPGTGIFIVAWNAVLITSATVATRQVSFRFGLGALPIYIVATSQTQAASLTYSYNVAQNVTATAATGAFGAYGGVIDLPGPFPLWVPPTDSSSNNSIFNTLTAGIQATDQWQPSNITALLPA